MTSPWTRALSRLLAAVFLVAGSLDVSKVVCISPNGHEAVEDPMSPCCAPGGTGASGFSEPTPCEGCKDFPITPATVIQSGRSDSSPRTTIDGSAPAAIAAPALNDAAPIARAFRAGQLHELLTSPPAAAPLRC